MWSQCSRAIEILPRILAKPEIQRLRAFEREAGGALTAAMDPGTPCPIDEMRPEFLPVLRTVISDENGRLWVEATATTGFTLTVFAADGTVLGETAMPERDPTVSPYARGGLLYLVTRDEYGVQSIEVYEVLGEA